MKTKLGGMAFAVVSALVFSLGETAQAAEASTISAYAGRYAGSAVFNASVATLFSPSATGSFATSKKKESGTLVLDASYDAGGMPLPVRESYTFRKHSLAYMLSIEGSTYLGSGRARIGNKKISYTATLSSSGTTIFVSGTVRRTSKRLLVTEQLTSNFTTLGFSYSLKRRGK